ncbi:MAG: folP [Rhodoglobus sp.]|nr:folP [Rhodoglobus sp.]
MGILNVTPDSFSDGGQFASLEAAIARGIQLREQGADLVDVGGESTRPGAERVPVEEEQARVMPVIRELVAAGVAVSVDTMNAETAFAAAAAGASVINDVSGGLADAGMYRVVAETGLHYVAMHWRGSPPRGQSNPAGRPDPAAWAHAVDASELATYDDVVADVRNELKARLAEMIVWGISPAKVILDPGLGFAKTPEHNWQLLGHLSELATLGHPLLIGASRKKFLAPFAPEGAAQRDEATAVVSALAAEAGVWAVRVHDVPSTLGALGVWTAWQNGGRS